MRKKSLFIIFVAMAFSTMAQNALYWVPKITSSSSLIREYAPGIDIVYNNTGSRQSFIYVDRIGRQVFEAISPYAIEGYRHGNIR